MALNAQLKVTHLKRAEKREYFLAFKILTITKGLVEFFFPFANGNFTHPDRQLEK